MSSYMVDDKVINEIVTWLYSNDRDGSYRATNPRYLRKQFAKIGFDLTDKDSAPALGQALFKMNQDGVAGRYGEGEEQEDFYTYCLSPAGGGLIHVYEQVATLMYQASEGKVPEQAIYKTLDETQSMMARQLVRNMQDRQAEEVRNRPVVKTREGSINFHPPSTDWKDAADVAKLVRLVLKEEYPETKFSVRTSKYAGGASIDIGWTDGPTTESVGISTGFLASGKNSSGSRSQWEGETFWSGAHYIFTRREFSQSFLETVASVVAQEENLPVLTVSVHEEGQAYIGHEGQSELANTPVHGSASFYSNLVMHKAHKITEGEAGVSESEEYTDTHYHGFRIKPDEATVNEILEFEADNPVEFEPNEITAAIQDPNKRGI